MLLVGSEDLVCVSIGVVEHLGCDYIMSYEIRCLIKLEEKGYNDCFVFNLSDIYVLTTSYFIIFKLLGFEDMLFFLCLLAVFSQVQTNSLQSHQVMLHFIRHAQSKFNKVAEQCEQKYGHTYLDSQEYLAEKFSPEYFDVEITEKGILQAEKAREMVRGLQVEIVLVSPMRRALRTCALIFENHPSKPSVIVEPSFREIMQSSNDIGSRVDQSMGLFPTFNFDKITDKQAWFVQTLASSDDRSSILNKLSGVNGAQRREIATEECLKVMKENWFQRRKDIAHQEEIKARVLPDYDQQKKILQFYAKKYSKIAVVAHSVCIQRYAGYKIGNCEVYSMFYDQLK